MDSKKVRKAIRISSAESLNKLIQMAEDDKRSYRATIEILIDQEWERRQAMKETPEIREKRI